VATPVSATSVQVLVAIHSIALNIIYSASKNQQYGAAPARPSLAKEKTKYGGAPACCTLLGKGHVCGAMAAVARVRRLGAASRDGRMKVTLMTYGGWRHVVVCVVCGRGSLTLHPPCSLPTSTHGIEEARGLVGAPRRSLERLVDRDVTEAGLQSMWERSMSMRGRVFHQRSYEASQLGWEGEGHVGGEGEGHVGEEIAGAQVRGKYRNHAKQVCARARNSESSPR
jgi:hypothetical protein